MLITKLFNTTLLKLNIFLMVTLGDTKLIYYMLNLCFYKSDFGFDACWSFLATSHGKLPCNGVEGTVK